jgi:hypothetical protein
MVVLAAAVFATPAAADVVIFEKTGQASDSGYISSFAMTFDQPGIYDFEVIGSADVGINFLQRGVYSYTYWIAGPSGPLGDPLYRRQDEGAFGPDRVETTNYFKASVTLPYPVFEYTTERPLGSGAIAPPGTLFYRQFKWESGTGTLDLHNLSDDPLEFTVRVTMRDLPAPVPEPSAWALMITGFGAAGLGLRRRRPLTA